MMWFFFALLCIMGWGMADLFYKLGSDDDDRYSHLKIAVWVGLVMGVCALCLLPMTETLTKDDSTGILQKMLRYSPASMSYIISMVIGYAGLRYLELSIVSPVQNASGAFSAIIMTGYFMLTAKDPALAIAEETGFVLRPESGMEILCNLLIAGGTALIIAGVIALAVAEQRMAAGGEVKREERKYRYGAMAMIFPLLYCLFDTAGTAADGILLSEEAGAGFGEMDVLVLYGLTFLLCGAVAWAILRIKTGKWYNPFARGERTKGVAAVCEEFGQVFYVYAMAARPVTAAPMVASYCIVSVILSRFIVGEKLEKRQLAGVLPVIIGIVMLGLAEGFGEA